MFLVWPGTRNFFFKNQLPSEISMDTFFAREPSLVFWVLRCLFGKVVTMTTICQFLVIIYRSLGGMDRFIKPSMRCSTWKGNDLTKLNRQVQLWVCPKFEPPTPHLCMIYRQGASFSPLIHSQCQLQV